MTFVTELELHSAVHQTLGYYALFQYPLDVEETLKYCSKLTSLSAIMKTLIILESESRVYTYAGYYSTLPEIKTLVKRRKKGNELAQKKEKSARLAGALIYQFPFVRFVGISGSLSKGFASEKSDFDYFIVTDKDRLWICRTILHLFKKLTFLFGQQHKFCMNYFVDAAHTAIEEQNLFTAIELSTLIPVKGSSIYFTLMKTNYWVKKYLPNAYQFSEREMNFKEKSNIFKLVTEFVLNLLFPLQLNAWLMKLTDRKWKRKWHKKSYPMEDYELAFKTTLHVSKNHPANHQKNILECLENFDLIQ